MMEDNITKKRKSNLNKGDFELKMSGVMGCMIIMSLMVFGSILLGVTKAYWDKKSEDQQLNITIGNATQCDIKLSRDNDKLKLVPYGANLDEGETYKKYLGAINVCVNDKYIEDKQSLYMIPSLYVNGERLDSQFNLDITNSSTNDSISMIQINKNTHVDLIEEGIFNKSYTIDKYNMSFGMYISFATNNGQFSTSLANELANKELTLLLEFKDVINEFNDYKINSINQRQYSEEFEGGSYSGMYEGTEFTGCTVKLNDEGELDNKLPVTIIGEISNGLDRSRLFYKITTQDNEDVSDLFRFKLNYMVNMNEEDYEYLSHNEYVDLERNYRVELEYSNSFNSGLAKSKLIGKTLQIEFIFAPSNVESII